MELLRYVIILTIFYYEIVNGATENSISVDTQLIKDENVFHVGFGSSATFKCRPANYNQKVEWINPEGTSLSRSSGRVLVQEHIVSGSRALMPFSVLTITRAQVEDTGFWQCRSEETVLDVAICVLDPLRFMDTKTYTVDAGRSITLTCEALGQPDPSIVWSRNGEVISDDNFSERYKTMTKYNSQGYESLLTITEVRPEDHGVYTCEGTQSSWRLQECTHTESINITLNVNYAPYFVIDEKPTPVFANFNTTVTFDCSALSYPPPVYTWYLEINDTLTEIKGYDNETGTFSLVADDTTMGQKYKCRAGNPYGYSFKGFTLLELLKPENPDKIELSSFYDGVDIKLTWDNELLFPIDAISCQYMERKGSRKPTESKWENAKLIKTEVYDDTLLGDDTEKTYTLSLTDLEEGTEYWARVRLNNELSASYWSKPVVFTTKSRRRENEPNELESTTEICRNEPNELKSTTENDGLNEALAEIRNLEDLLNVLKTPIYASCVMTGILVVGLVLATLIKLIKHLLKNMREGKSNVRIYIACFIIIFLVVGYVYNTFY